MPSHDSALFSGTITQLFASISGTLLAISDGMTYGWTAPIIPYLISEKSHIKTTKHEAEWLETTLMLGSFFGLPTTIFLIKKIGRKKSLILAAITSLLGWIVIGLANKMVYIFIARFFFGVAGNMSFVSAPMYVAEIADQKIRGFLSSIIYLQMLVGFVIVYSVGPFLPFYVTPIIGASILLTGLIIFWFMPESPYYLIYNNQGEEAHKSLQYFRPNRDISIEFSEITKAVQRQKAERGRLQDIILVPSNRKAIIIMAMLNFGQHASAISVILMNLHLVLEAAGSIYIEPSIAGIIFSAIMLVSAQIASLLLDRCGRKLLLVISSVLTGFCLLTLAIYFHLKLDNFDLRKVSWIPVVSVMVYAAVFKIGLGLVPIVLTAELFSAKMKAVGMTIADAMYVVGAIISIQLYQGLTDLLGIHVPFYCFAAGSFSITVLTIMYIPETKGKTLEEIQILMKGQKHEPKELIRESFELKGKTLEEIQILLKEQAHVPPDVVLGKNP